AVTYILYPLELTAIGNYVQRMIAQKAFIKPPRVLFDPAIFFTYGTGVWSIILSALRILIQRDVRQALRDLIGGIFAFSAVHLLTNYAANVTTGQMTLAYFAVAIGCLIIGNTVITFGIPKRRNHVVEQR
ncbi:MAG: hypothetical protein JSV76_00130, partial [Candidatus Bathyarchaeota archaeon]